MRAWFAGLAPRERALLVFAAVFVLAFIYYAAVWAPLSAGIHRRSHRVEHLQSLVTWLDEAGQRAHTLRAAHADKAPAGQQPSLLSIIDRSSKNTGLGQAVTRIQPTGTKRARVWLENASFTTLVHWLDALQSRFGVKVASASITAAKQSGRVNARLSLTRGGTS